MRKIVYNVAPYITPILLAMTMLGKISALVIFVIAIVLTCFMPKKEAGISFALVMPVVFGFLFFNIGIGIPGSIIALVIAFILLYKELAVIKNNPDAIKYIGAIILITIFSFVYGGVSSSGKEKLTDLLITLAIGIWAFYPITTSKNIDLAKIAVIYLISGIFLIAVALDFYGYTRTFNLFDFESFRASTIYNRNLELPHVVYHIPGMIGCYTTAFYLSGKKNGIKVKDLIFLGTALWLILISGTRQAILCYFIIVACWTMIKSNKLQTKNIILTFVFCIAGYIFLSSLEVESIQKVFDTTNTTEERLNRGYDFALKLINENTAWGVGFGNYYNPMTNQRYPHNLILEILCEMGVVGLIAMSLIVFIFVTRNKFSLFKKTTNDNFAFIIFIPYFIRAMVSDDLSHNIILFIVIFTLFNKKHKKINKYEQDITYSNSRGL